MRRRELIGIIALASFVARYESSAAQTTPKTIRLAYLAPIRIPHLVEALTGGLRDLGYVEGQNLSIEYRFAGENPKHFGLTRYRACEARPSGNRDGGDSGNTGGGESDLKHSNRGCDGGRPCAQRGRPEPRETGRQRDRRDALLGRVE